MTKQNKYILKDSELEKLESEIEKHFDEEVVSKKAPIEITDDFNAKLYARKKILETIEQLQNSIEVYEEIAYSLQTPRAIEVLAHLHQTLVDCNVKLLELDRTEAQTEKIKNTSKNTETKTTNNVFIGTTKELDEYIKKQIKRD